MWEELLKPGATGAPQIVEWVAIGFGIFLATFMGRLQWGKGRKEANGGSTQVAEIAGAVIDKRDAEIIIAAVKDNTEAIVDNTAASRSLAKSVNNLAARIEQGTDATKSLSDQMGVMIRELIRSQQ